MPEGGFDHPVIGDVHANLAFAVGAREHGDPDAWTDGPYCVAWMQNMGADTIENVGGTALSDLPMDCAILDRWVPCPDLASDRRFPHVGIGLPHQLSSRRAPR
jgi:hypothetical protein